MTEKKIQNQNKWDFIYETLVLKINYVCVLNQV
jgi:hypothetical protein